MSDRYTFNLPDPDGSDILAYLKGLSAIDIEVCSYDILPFRSTILTNTVLTDRVTQILGKDFDFVCDGIQAYVQPLAADTVPVSQHVYVQFRTTGRGRQMFTNDNGIPLSLLCASIGTGASLAAVAYSPTNARLQRVPTVYPAGSEITAYFLGEAGLGAVARIVDIGLLGYQVRKGLLVGGK